MNSSSNTANPVAKTPSPKSVGFSQEAILHSEMRAQSPSNEIPRKSSKKRIAEWSSEISDKPTQDERKAAGDILIQFYDFVTDFAFTHAIPKQITIPTGYFDLIFRLIMLPNSVLAVIFDLFNETNKSFNEVANFKHQLEMHIFVDQDFRDFLFAKERDAELKAFIVFCREYHCKIKRINFSTDAGREMENKYRAIQNCIGFKKYLAENQEYTLEEKRIVFRNITIGLIRGSSTPSQVAAHFLQFEKDPQFSALMRKPTEKPSLFVNDYYRGQRVSLEFLAVIKAAKVHMGNLIVSNIQDLKKLNDIKKYIDELEVNDTYKLVRDRIGYTQASFWGYQYNEKPVSQMFTDIIKVAKDRMLKISHEQAKHGLSEDLVQLTNIWSPHSRFLLEQRTRFAIGPTQSFAVAEQLKDQVVASSQGNRK